MRLPLLLLALLALLWSPPARAATPLWRVTEVAGDVRLQTADGVRPARRGASLSAGDAIVTAAGARAVLTRGTEFVIVSSGTRLRLPGADRPGGIVQMLQDFGSAVYRIQKKMTPHFGVETPYLAAVVKGTTFRVDAGARGASVQVLEGRVEVATGDGSDRRMAVPGMTVEVSAAQPDRLTVGSAAAAALSVGTQPAPTGEAGGDTDRSADLVQDDAPTQIASLAVLFDTVRLVPPSVVAPQPDPVLPTPPVAAPEPAPPAPASTRKVVPFTTAAR